MHRLQKYKRTNLVNGVCKIMSAFTNNLRSLASNRLARMMHPFSFNFSDCLLFIFLLWLKVNGFAN